MVKLLKSNADLIEDYFSMEIDKDGNLVTIPLLYEGYVPYLGNFILLLHFMYILNLLVNLEN